MKACVSSRESGFTAVLSYIRMQPDTAPVRPGEELNTRALAAYLGVAEVAVEQFPGGHSNLTYLVRAEAREYVLRRPPLGPVAPKAHDMAREYAVLRAVAPLFPPAPQVYRLCEDPGIIGAVFFLMERRRGVILRGAVPPPWTGEAPRISRAFVDCLIELHAIDVERHGLSALGKPDGYLDRQVRGWTDRWNRAKTEDMPDMDHIIRWLADRLPASPPPTLIHNDYKLDNLMLDAADPSRIVAVLDWEMTTVGDPLSDLGLTLCYWTLTDGRERVVTTRPGWYSPRQLVDYYAERTGRDCSHITYYEVLGIFKLAVILQQIYFRWVRGQTQDERFRAFDQRVKSLVAAAAERVA
jgi:aminoglycoside phosphotransferase (APT) family kinase protein